MTDDPYDRTYWIGAMNFLIEKIYEDNPKARIVLVGHYSANQGNGNQSTRHLCEAQEIFAEYWNVPLIKIWKLTVLSFNEIANGVVSSKESRRWSSSFE